MTKQKTLPSYYLALIFLTFCNLARADSFDEAVNQFLKGFEYCKEAKSHLSGNRIPQAQAALKQYQRHLNQATQINPDILTSSNRGMDGNLKFCQRVTRDVEVEVGMPTMNKALTACDAAQQALKDETPDQAQIHFTEFKTQRDEALKLAPSLADIFTVKNQISRCDRIESKIAAFSKQQQALALSLETAQEESVAYAASCQKTLETLTSESVDAPVVRDAHLGLDSALSHKKNVRDEKLAYKAFSEDPKHPAKLGIDKNLAKGDRCVEELTTVIQLKEQELAKLDQSLASYNSQLTNANTSCLNAQKSATSATTRANYDAAKQTYETALKTRNDTRDALGKTTIFTTYDGREDVVRIEQQMQSLNDCLNKTKSQLSSVFATLAPTSVIATAEKVAPVATLPANNEQAGIPANKISGTIRMMDTSPELALFYVDDDSIPASTEITIERTGFSRRLYVVSKISEVQLKNKDYNSHRITIGSEALNFTEILARLQPRQQATGKINWPEHNLVELKGDRGAFPVSYIANISSARYVELDFDGKDRLEFKFDNTKGATSAHLLMPDADPLAFTLSKGETKSMAITRKGVPIGSVLIKGE